MVLQGAYRGDNGVERAAAAAQDFRAGGHRRQHPATALGTLRSRTAAARAAMGDQCRNYGRSYAGVFHVNRRGDAPR